MERDFKGIWIPREVWLSKELTMQEKLFLVEIDSLNNEKGCYAGNDYFADFFDLSKSRCSEIIKSLEKKGFIEINYIYKEGSKEIRARIIKVKNLSAKPLRNLEDPIRKTEDPLRDIELPPSEKAKENNTVINNTGKYNKENIKEKSKFKKSDVTIEVKNKIQETNITDNLKNKLIEFVDYRKEIKKPIKTYTVIKALLNQLGKDFIDETHLIDSINNTISNQYQGVFPKKITSYKENVSNKTAAGKSYTKQWLEAYERGEVK